MVCRYVEIRCQVNVSGIMVWKPSKSSTKVVLLRSTWWKLQGWWKDTGAQSRVDCTEPSDSTSKMLPLWNRSMARSQPLHTQATQSDLDSEWALNLRPWHRRKRTWVFNYSLMLGKYINLAINASMSVVREPSNEVYVSKREFSRGRF
jgi:hypothetical protein